MNKSDLKNNTETSVTSDIDVCTHALVMKSDANIFSNNLKELPTLQKQTDEAYERSCLPDGILSIDKEDDYQHKNNPPSEKTIPGALR